MRKWLCLIMVVVAFAGFGQGFAAEKPYAGQELKISFIAGFPTNIGLKTLIPEFEKETGIRITIIETGYGVILEKNILDLSAQTGAYDVLHVESLWFPQYLPYLYPINEFMDDPKLFNAAEYDLEDLTSYTPLTLGEILIVDWKICRQPRDNLTGSVVDGPERLVHQLCRPPIPPSPASPFIEVVRHGGATGQLVKYQGFFSWDSRWKLSRTHRGKHPG